MEDSGFERDREQLLEEIMRHVDSIASISEGLSYILGDGGSSLERGGARCVLSQYRTHLLILDKVREYSRKFGDHMLIEEALKRSRYFVESHNELLERLLSKVRYGIGKSPGG